MPEHAAIGHDSHEQDEAADLAAWLRRQFDEDALWAVEASRDGDNPVPEGGAHWQWVGAENDAVIEPDPLVTEFVDDDHRWVSLRSVERYPSSYSDDGLPQFAIHSAAQVPAAVGGHILRHDPAWVLADVAVKRAILDEHRCDNGDSAVCGRCTPAPYPCRTVKLLGALYAHRPGFQEAWRVP